MTRRSNYKLDSNTLRCLMQARVGCNFFRIARSVRLVLVEGVNTGRKHNLPMALRLKADLLWRLARRSDSRVSAIVWYLTLLATT